ncbi:hypothetical protein [Cellulophaga baltica]|uniref:Glutathione synthase/RimK-type ligase, ATP-grasp superfamily n=1 Tax=Cellulophaga baltica TaxID=76594 RepID=A0A1G7JMZ1_9FLAO|nr:hypothetical protein [Cellulophaga baltica]SDF26307.1 Glutathione synthase/RimK-type ligase, ATP-grasp superfamily [Cellulophaga baltica]
MIYITTECQDVMTDLTIEWIISNKKDFRRFNDSIFVEPQELLSLKNVKKIWQRRGAFNFLPTGLKYEFTNKRELLNYVTKENRDYNIYLEHHFRTVLGSNYIGSFTKEVSSNNKLINLDFANEVGLDTPEYMVTCSKKELLQFYNRHQKIITKDLKSPVNIKTKRKNISSSGVKLLSESSIQKIQDNFAPIFLQKYIEKNFEVRIFVFNKKLYCMAIFSQLNDDTKVDFRNDHSSNPNRCIPYTLPSAVESKIWKLLNILDFDTCSIDLIVTPDNQYYFLEINPMGQFHWLSSNCNYYIEKEIANFLCK